MFEIIYNLIILILCLVGVTSIMRGLYRWLLRPSDTENQVYMVLLRNESCENDLRTAVQFSKEFGGRYIHSIICIDTGLNDESKAIFNRFCKEYHTLYLCSTKGIEDFLNNIPSKMMEKRNV